MSNFILQTSHPLIQSEQTFVLDRKLISIHSVDRDYQKWPNSNHFGIDLGEAFHNVQSMRLINFAVPSNNYTFSTAYQNTKMSFTYSLNYPIYLSDFDAPATAEDPGAYNTFRNILQALFGTWTGATLPYIPPDVTIQFFHATDLEWRNLPISSLVAVPPVLPGEFVGGANAGIYRLVWAPSEFTITIPEGSYSPTNLTETIQTLMNTAIYNASSLAFNNTTANGGAFDFLPGPPIGPLTDPSNVTLPSIDSAGNLNNVPPNVSHWVDSRGKGISPFVVYYNSVTNKVYFGTKAGTFTLNFAKQEIYDPTCDVNKAIFHQYTKWGLPAYLGFDKKNYVGQVVDISGISSNGSGGNPYQFGAGGLYFPFEPTTPWLTGDARTLNLTSNNAAPPPPGIFTGSWTNVVGSVVLGNTTNGGSANGDSITKNLVSFVGAEFNLDINGEDALYMEIDRYNSIDEIYPYSERTGHLYNNDLGHRVNGSFAKIPLTHVPFGQEMGSRNNFVLNVFHSDPPIQRIDRLKFTFRYHDGRLVDFKNLPFSFTLEFNMLKDEQERGKRVRVPPLYNL